MDDLTLKRLEALIATATNLPPVNGKYSEEARTNAIRAAFIIKENNLLDVLRNAKTVSAAPPKAKPYSPPPPPSTPPIDLEKLNFRGLPYSKHNWSLCADVVKRFIDHLKYKAKSNSYPIYSIDDILHILKVTINQPVKDLAMLKNTLR